MTERVKVTIVMSKQEAIEYTKSEKESDIFHNVKWKLAKEIENFSYIEAEIVEMDLPNEL